MRSRGRAAPSTGRASATRAALESQEPDQDIEDDVARFYDALFANASLRRHRLRPSVLHRRLSACVRAAGGHDVAEATQRVMHDALASERALHAIAIGVTGFFRDPQMFTSLSEEFESLAARRPRGLRVLSVGCSDGRELYSVAMMLDQLSIPARALHGVDCRARAIQAARSGRYAAIQAGDIAEDFRPTFSAGVETVDGRDVQVREELRAKCTWEVADAFRLVASEPYDLVLCRNLLIYLTQPASLELWDRLHRLVATDGLVMVGKAERPLPRARMHRIAPGLYRPSDVRS